MAEPNAVNSTIEFGMQQDRFQLGTKVQISTVAPEVQRLNSQTIADQHQPSPRHTPECRGKHPAHLFECRHVPLKKRAQQRFGVATRLESVT